MKIGQILKSQLLLPNSPVKELRCIVYKAQWRKVKQGYQTEPHSVITNSIYLLVSRTAHVYDYEGEYIIRYNESSAYLTEPHEERTYDRDETQVDGMWNYYCDLDGNTSCNWTDTESWVFVDSLEEADKVLELYKSHNNLTVEGVFSDASASDEGEVFTPAQCQRIADSIQDGDATELCKIIIGGE